MQKLFGGMVVAALALSVTSTAHAQRRNAANASMGGAKHELGVDLGLAYVKPDQISGGIVIETPVDVRFGFVSASKMMWEARGTLNFSTVGGSTAYDFEPGINVLYANSAGGHHRGMYFTGGAGLILADNGTNSGTAVALNAGVGWRKPYGSGAWRYELGFRWSSENTTLGLPSAIAIGGRIGISLWH
jgi:hypothetical protein